MKIKSKKHFGKIAAVALTSCVIMGGAFVGMNMTADSGIGTLVVSAASVTSNGFTWNLNGSGVLTVSGTGELSGFDWNTEGFNKADVKKFVVGNGITSVSSYLMYNAKNLQTVTLPATIQKIEGYAFSGCTSLTSINMSSGLTSIGYSAFNGCTSLTSINIPDSVTSIGYDAFRSCTKLSSFHYPKLLTSTGSNIFCDAAVTKVTVPEGITEIPADAFNGANNLTTVVLPSTLKTIKADAFDGCTSLTSINIPDSVTTIGYDAFRGCAKLSSFHYPRSLTSVGERAFENTALTCIEVPEGVTSLPSKVFYYANNLETVILPDTLVMVGSMAFKGCKNLKYVIMPSSVLTIESGIFSNADNVTVYGKSGSQAASYAAENNVPFAEESTIVKGLEIFIAPTRKLYEKGESLLVDGSVALAYKHGPKKHVSMKKSMLSGYDMNKTGEQSVVVTYNGFKTSFKINVVYPMPELVNNSKLSAYSLEKGKSVTITGAASGGAEIYQYAYIVQKPDGEWVVIKNYSKANTFTWTPASTGKYTVQVKVKDIRGTVKAKNLTLNVFDPLVNTSKISAASITKGLKVTLTGSAKGGLAPYKYAYVVQSPAGKWTVLKDYSTASSHTWAPASFGKYTVQIKAKDSNGTVAVKSFALNVTNDFVNISKLSAAAVIKGSSVDLLGAAAGGTAPYQYAYVVQSPAGKWTVLKEYSTTAKYTWKPASVGKYTVQIKAKDNKGTVAVKSFALNVANNLVNNSKISATYITKGNSVTLTGAASGGTTPYQYAYVVQSPAGKWTVLKDYSTTATHKWAPASTGKYTVQIKVKDGKGTVDVKSFTLNVAAALVNSSKISSTSIKKGSSVTLTGAASGGTSPYQYAYVVQSPAGKWTVLKDYSTTATHKWAPASTGKYTVQIKVKDSKGATAVKTFTLTVSA